VNPGNLVPILLLTALAVTSIPAQALHELDHRYDVTGYVLDAQRRPVAGTPITVRMGSEVLGSGRTDSSGHYRIRLHLHDSDRGRDLVLKTPEHQGTIRVTLTPGDTSTQRIHHANFIGGELEEGALDGPGGLPVGWLIAAALALLLVAGAALQRHRRRLARRRQRAQARAAGSGGKSSRKSGKSKRKRRK